MEWISVFIESCDLLTITKNPDKARWTEFKQDKTGWGDTWTRRWYALVLNNAVIKVHETI